MEKKKRIKYFSYYGCNNPLYQRDNSPAADSKIDYIIDVLNQIGYGVDLISRAPSACAHYLHSSVEQRGDNTLRYFASFGKTKSLFRIFNKWFVDLQFFIWCIFHLQHGEQVIVYHSLGYDATFIKLCKIKRVRIIGEIEEIYQDVSKQRKSLSENEYKFINLCSKYIFPTTLLDINLNTSYKPSVIVHGVYSVENIVEDKFNDGKIHVVYGGTLDPNKGGAAAAAAAAFLPPNYHIHICGFGDATQIKRIVKEVNECSEAKVSFEGELKGDAYKHFIQKCHIGLSTQNPDAAFNATSFPSKILVYLSNGLKVVSIRIPAIEQSAVADSIFFYDEQKAERIARAIESACNVGVKGLNPLFKLDKEFKHSLFNLLSK